MSHIASAYYQNVCTKLLPKRLGANRNQIIRVHLSLTISVLATKEKGLEVLETRPDQLGSPTWARTRDLMINSHSL